MKVLIAAVVAVTLFCIGGCTREAAPTLRVAANVWPGYEALYLARDLGEFNATPIHPIEYTSATEVMRAFRNGSIDAACLTLDESLLLASQGQDFRIVLVSDFSNGADVILGNPALHDMADLRGRRVGVEDTALGAFFLTLALQKAGLNHADVRVVPLQVQDHERAFTDGSVDAVVTFEPVRGKLLARGAHILFDSSRIPGEIVDVLLVRSSYLQQYPDAVTVLVRGWFRAMTYTKRAPDEALARMARREGVSEAEYRDALRGLNLPDRDENLRLLEGNAPALQPVMQRLADFMLHKQLLAQRVEVRGLIDARPLQAMQP